MATHIRAKIVRTMAAHVRAKIACMKAHQRPDTATFASAANYRYGDRLRAGAGLRGCSRRAHGASLGARVCYGVAAGPCYSSSHLLPSAAESDWDTGSPMLPDSDGTWR